MGTGCHGHEQKDGNLTTLNLLKKIVTNGTSFGNSKSYICLQNIFTKFQIIEHFIGQVIYKCYHPS